MTIASADYNGPTYANILETAKVAGDWINAHGGIKGHPVKVTACDEQGDPNQTARCGRLAIADHDLAVVGSFTLNGNSIVPELAAAHTAWFGICCAVSADELTSPIVQQIGSGLSLLASLAPAAVADGCKKIALVQLNVGATADFTTALVKAGLKSANGPPLDKVVLLPATAQDYSPEVAQATTGTDCIIANLAPTNYASFMPAFVQSGAHQRLFGAQGNLDVTVTKAFPAATEGAIVAGSYSDISLPVWADYRSALATYKAPTKLNYNSLAGLGTWSAYMAFEQIVNSLTGPINNRTFLAAAQKATVSVPGAFPSVDFTKSYTGLGGTFKNAVNRSVSYDVVRNGVLVPLYNGKFFDMTNAMDGMPLSPANTPAAVPRT